MYSQVTQSKYDMASHFNSFHQEELTYLNLNKVFNSIRYSNITQYLTILFAHIEIHEKIENTSSDALLQQFIIW